MFSISTGQEMGQTQHIHSAQLVRSFFFLKLEGKNYLRMVELRPLQDTVKIF